MGTSVLLKIQGLQYFLEEEHVLILGRVKSSIHLPGWLSRGRLDTLFPPHKDSAKAVHLELFSSDSSFSSMLLTG